MFNLKERLGYSKYSADEGLNANARAIMKKYKGVEVVDLGGE